DGKDPRRLEGLQAVSAAVEAEQHQGRGQGDRGEGGGGETPPPAPPPHGGDHGNTGGEAAERVAEGPGAEAHDGDRLYDARRFGNRQTRPDHSPGFSGARYPCYPALAR